MAVNATRKQLPLRRIEVVAANTAHDFGSDPPNGIIVQGTGNFTFVPAGQSSEVTIALSAGMVHPIKVKSVPSSNAVQFAAGWSADD